MKKRLGILFGVVMSVIFLGFLSCARTSASSILDPDDEADFSQNNVLYYEPCSTEGSGSTLGGDITIAGKTAEEKIWSGLASFLTDEQAAGILGNIGAEENPSYGPTIREVGQSGNLFDRSAQLGLGLIQWSFGRRVNLLNYIKKHDSSLLKYFEDDKNARMSGDEFIKKHGDDVANKIYQLEIQFLKNELDKGYKGYYKLKDAGEAAVWFRAKVERAGVYSDEKRSDKAKEVLKKYGGKTIEGGTGGGVPCNTCEKGNLNINATAVCLAWPLDTEEDKTVYPGGSPSEAFETAHNDVTKGSTDACAKAGASCDMFVSTVVRWSGYDKKYPLGNVNDQYEYAKSHPDLWEVMDWNGDKSKIKAGDIIWENGGRHTQIAVEDSDNKLWIASASHCDYFGKMKNWWGPRNPARIIRAKNAKNASTGVSVKDGVDSSASAADCDVCGGENGEGDVSLKDGGLSKDEAQKLMDIYKGYAGANGMRGNTKIANKYYIKVGCHGNLFLNCPSFVKYFVNRYTSKQWKTGMTGDGRSVSQNLARDLALKTGSEPRPYAVFSDDSYSPGHTGVVLGVDSAKKTMLVGEAGCMSGSSTKAAYDYIGVHEVPIKKYHLYTYLEPIMKLEGN